MDCVLCREPITNPLCQACLGEATAAWLQDHAPERIEGLREITESWHSEEGVMCVHCKHDFVLCTYCYTKEIFNWLRDGALQLKYLKFFNFFT